MNRKVLLVGLGLIGIGAILLGLRWCAPPPPPPPPNRPGDYTQAGNDGGARPARIDREITVHLNGSGNSFVDPELSTLACGTPYKVGVSAQETVPAGGCAGYNYSRLLAQALVPLDIRVGQLQCDTGCGPKAARVIYAKFECRNTTARVLLKKEVICPRPDDAPQPPGIDLSTLPVNVSTTATTPGEDGSFATPTRRAETTGDLTLGATTGWVLNCPQSVVFAYRYNEFDRGRCAGLGNYEPYVARAEARATAHYHNPLACGGGCIKQAPAFLRREWSCDPASGEVSVNLWFQVECKR